MAAARFSDVVEPVDGRKKLNKSNKEAEVSYKENWLEKIGLVGTALIHKSKFHWDQHCKDFRNQYYSILLMMFKQAVLGRLQL
jgi:hypothetical protein